jgi:hypothetical protein
MTSSQPLVAQLLAALQRRVPAQREWLDAVAAEADASTLETAFIESTRRVGAAPLALDFRERRSVRGLGLSWRLRAWAIDDAARTAWWLRACEVGVGLSLAERRWQFGDVRQRIALLRGLALVPEPTDWLALAIRARHGAVRAVFEALACDNPYPATHFHDVHFEDMVLAALAADLPMRRIIGLRRRLTPRLCAEAARLVATRRAYGQRVPVDMQRLAHDLGSAA